VTVARVATITQVLLGAAAAWFLMDQLAPILRPLLIAVFLAYVLMPYHNRLRGHIGGAASIGVLAGITAGLLVALALITYAHMLGLSDEMPQLQHRVAELVMGIEDLVGPTSTHDHPSQVKLEQTLSRLTQILLAGGVGVLLDACVVAMYVLFLLLEGSRFPERVRRAYPPERAEAILKVAEEVSDAIVKYLRVKVKASLVLAVPVGIILALLGVKFSLLWAALTFLCNFIPYIGPIIAYGTPVTFAFLWFGVTWQPITAAALLLACHITSAVLIEPRMIGKAMGLSPLVLLAALAFWGLLWGIPGMFLAVPLTVVTIIVLDHFESTRSIAQLLRGE
jgi:AI-2 transport protein TqsA